MPHSGTREIHFKLALKNPIPLPAIFWIETIIPAQIDFGFP